MLHRLARMLMLSIFFTYFCVCSAYRILIYFPIPGKSHATLGEAYVHKLLEAGHEVTYITPILINTNNPRLKQINISENFKFLSEDMFNVEKFMKDEINLQDQIPLSEIIGTFMYKTLKLNVVQEFIHDTKEEYDVVIVEYLHSELGAGLSTVFNAPLIWSSPIAVYSFMTALVEDHLNPTYAGHFLSKDHSLSFWNKINDLYTISKIRFIEWLNREKYNNEFKSIYGSAVAKRGRQLPHFENVKYNASLVLSNSDVITSFNVALPQNYKHIGGYHLKETIDPLPEHLQKIMDEAKDGVIYFSLGSMLRGNKIPEKTKRQLIDMFSELKQKVIWKLEQGVPNLPKNVHVVPWAPQRSILNHPNCILFITHGGLLSTFETLENGIPVIGMPFYGDQFLNVNRAVKQGFGKRIDFKMDVAEKLRDGIKEMLDNPSYRERVKELSMIFHDRIVPPGKELVYWVEYVVKTRGAPHLRAAALDFYWFSKLYLDVLAVFILIFVLLLMILRKVSVSIMDHKKKD